MTLITDSPEVPAETRRRQRLMAVCSIATEAELGRALEALAPLPAICDVRAAETGLVMLRGRIGGDGQPFNFGEATVARACVRLVGGEMGFGYMLGRSQAKARMAAIIDALGQLHGWAGRIDDALTAPVESRAAAARAARQAETDGTRVDFFTLVRGED